MRYSSSRDAASSSSYGTGYSSYSSTSSPAADRYSGPSGFSSNASIQSSSNLHYKKDGSLDMRYTSSKEAVGVSGSQPYGSNDLHLKKDGSLDMRYSSSKEACGSYKTSQPSSDPHYKKDGTLDMRFSSSKVYAELSDKMQLLATPSANNARLPDIPEYVPVKADGTPDMRKAAAKNWVANQGAVSNRVPNWVPKHKDGTINLNTAVGREFAKMHRSVDSQPSTMREDYWRKQLMDEMFRELLANVRADYIPLPSRPPVLRETVPSESSQYRQTSAKLSAGSMSGALPVNVLQIDYDSLVFDKAGKEAGVLGRGSFGVVLKAYWNGKKVAVKKLHLEQLNRKEQVAFCKELRILAHLGTHKNLVELYAYCLEPPCIVMELIELGSLSHLLHYSTDANVEAKMTDGRIKKNLLYGIACGMYQLHFSKIVHGDLKPQNVLVSNDYEPKVTDFGLATLRGKSSSAIASSKLEDDNKEDGLVGGTAGYMAPELLDSTSPPDFSSDVYSFGILMNEVIAEEEPYADQYANFAGRGPFGAANYAKQGRRPTISLVTPDVIRSFITTCWSNDSRSRPTFEKIIAIIEQPSFVIPNTIL